MTFKSIATRLVSLAAMVTCAAVAIGAVWAVDRGLDLAWPHAGPAGRLAFGLTAPFGVVLFALLVESAGRVAGRVDAPAV